MSRIKEHQKELQRYYNCIVEQAEDLQEHIINDTIPEDEELATFWEDGYFDTIKWINYECLEANKHDLLLATGGPAYGVSLVHGAPVFWYQDWYTEKFCKQLQGSAFDFYVYIFDTLEELDC